MERRQLLKLGAHLLAAQALAGCSEGIRGGPEADGPLDAVAFTGARAIVPLRFGDVACLTRGAGPAALFLHGFPLNGFQWRGVIEALAPHRRCIAPDFLGMGHSRAADGQDLRPSAQVEMLIALLDALEVSDVDLVANDSGGAVAQLMVIRHPARVRSLLLTNCDSEPECPPAAMLPVIDLARRGEFCAQWLEPWARDPQLARSDKGIGGMCYADRAHPTDEALQMYFGALIGSQERQRQLHAYAVALAENPLAGTRAALRACRVPVRIVWGEGDTIFSSAGAQFLADSLGNSRGIRWLPRAKLFWPEERPDIVAAEARQLWERVT